MGRSWDAEEGPYFWDDVVSERGKDSAFAIVLVIGIVGWVVEDPFRGTPLHDDVFVLHSVPVMHDNVLYAYRIAYRLKEYDALQDGKSGLITLDKAEPYDPGDMLDEEWGAKNHH
jgi:hypothetical protein